MKEIYSFEYVEYPPQGDSNTGLTEAIIGHTANELDDVMVSYINEVREQGCVFVFTDGTRIEYAAWEIIDIIVRPHPDTVFYHMTLYWDRS